MNDEINRVILELRAELRRNGEIEIYNTFVNDIGKIYEMYGYGAAKTYLLDKLQDKNRKKQMEARIVLNILDKINNMNIPREIGSFIIRKINSIKYYRGE